MTIKDLEVRHAAASERLVAAQEKDDADAELRAIADEEAARAELLTEQKKIRKLAGKRLERPAKAAAAGAYQVAYFDVGLYDIDPDKLPAGGVVVLRSPSVEGRRRSEAAMKAASDDPAAEAEAAITLICDCTVAPTFALLDPLALAYRMFWETTGRGVVNNAVMQINQLGGFQTDHFKRVSK